MIVKAAVARDADHGLAVESLVLDEPRADEILVRLIASGVAGRDLEALAEGRPIAFPFVGGGEGAGIVERVGAAVEDIEPGDTVVLTPAHCGRCAACLAGSPLLCRDFAALNESGTRRDSSRPFEMEGVPVHGFFQGQSSFATHALCRATSAVKVPSEAPLEVLACLGGELRAAASILLHWHAQETLEAVVITGAGASGLAAVMTAKALDIETIILADPDAGRRALASELGATLTVHTDDDLAAVVRSLTGTGASLAVETTGHERAIEACVASLASGKTCALLRGAQDWSHPDDLLAFEGVAIVGLSRGCGAPHAVVRKLAGWHAEGRFPVERMIVYFPFEHINDAIEALAAEKAVKPVVRFAVGPFAGVDRADVDAATVEAPEDAPEESAPSDGERDIVGISQA